MPLTVTTASSAACLHTWQLYNPAPSAAGPAEPTEQQYRLGNVGGKNTKKTIQSIGHGECMAVQRTHPYSIFATAATHDGLMLAGGKDGSVVWCKSSARRAAQAHSNINNSHSGDRACTSTDKGKSPDTSLTAELHRKIGPFYAAANTDHPLQLSAPIFALAIHPDQTVAAVGLADGEWI